MNFAKHLPLMAFLLMTVVCHQASAIQSYREWKTTQILEAQGKVVTLKTQIDIKKQEKFFAKRNIAQGRDPNLTMSRTTTEANSGKEAQVEKMEKQLQQELYDLDLARDLTVSDYFAGYLTKMHDKKAAFAEVAGKLSPEEVAELMNAYANSAFGARTTDIPASAVNSRDTIK